MRKRISSLTVFCVALVLSCLLVAGGCWGDASSDYQQGMELYDAGKYAEAIEVFQRVVSTDAQLACGAQYQIGICYHVTGMLDEAIPALEKALSMSREGELAFDIRISLAHSFMKAKLWGEASSVIQQIALIAPEHGGHMLFMSCVKQRDYERAAAALIYSLVITPGIEHIGSNGLPSWLLYSSDRKSVSKYVKSFCDAITRGATITTTYQIRADLQAMLEKCGQTDGAATVVSSDPVSEYAVKLYELGSVYFRGGRHKQAAQVFEDALKLGLALGESQQLSTRYLLGVCHWKLKDMDEAKSYMTDIVTRYPDSEKAKWARAHLAGWSEAVAGRD